MQARKRRIAEKAAIGEIEDTEVKFLSAIYITYITCFIII